MLEQPGLWDEEPEDKAVFVPLSYRAGLIEQIMRDEATLRMDPIYHAPCREFYEERIVAYRAEVFRLTAEEPLV